jgi:hypothetical protein
VTRDSHTVSKHYRLQTAAVHVTCVARRSSERYQKRHQTLNRLHEDYEEYEEEREVGSSERHYGWGEQNISSVLKVPRHCPFVLLVSESMASVSAGPLHVAMGRN